eukprot:9472409-Pyramimonas_sp.AAC.1
MTSRSSPAWPGTTPATSSPPFPTLANARTTRTWSRPDPTLGGQLLRPLRHHLSYYHHRASVATHAKSSTTNHLGVTT